MKSALILSLVASAFALNVPTQVKRDAASIASALASISSAVGALDTGINAFSGAADVASLQAASDAVVTQINAGTDAATASDAIPDTDALNLVPPLNALAALVDTTITDLINKKDTLVSAGVGNQVLADLNQQLTATNAFSAATTAKLSTLLQSAAAGYIQPIIDSLNRGIAAFTGIPDTSTTTAGNPPTTTAGNPPTTTAGNPPTTTAGNPPTTTAGNPPTTTAGPTSTGKGGYGGWGQWGNGHGNGGHGGWGQWGHGGGCQATATVTVTKYSQYWKA